jgi:hypothetical protein
MSNIRIRSAVLAFFFGNIGADMLLLRSEQIRLFLFLGGPLLAVAVVSSALAVATGNAAWLFITGFAKGFLTFWSLARIFEYLNLSDEEFIRRLEGKDQPLTLATQANNRLSP